MWVEDFDPCIGFGFAMVHEFGSTKMHGLDGAKVQKLATVQELDGKNQCVNWMIRKSVLIQDILDTER